LSREDSAHCFERGNECAAALERPVDRENCYLKIAQPFMAGTNVTEREQVPKGRKNNARRNFFRPAGLHWSINAVTRALKRWAIFSSQLKRHSLSCAPMKFSLVALFLFVILAHAENWPQWRGPRLDGTSAEATVPVHWSATRESEIYQPGHSS
jgi:hypothetical protein